MAITNYFQKFNLNKNVQPIVSFIIPTLNAEQYISRCLSSICAIPLLYPYEIIVLDNGSTDRTCEIVTDFGVKPEVIPHVHVSTLRNRGADLAMGDYLAFIDADVEISPDWLQNAIEVFRYPSRYPNVVASGCFPGVPRQATWVQKTWDIHQRSPFNNNFGPVTWLSSMNLVVLREVFLRINGFNEALETSEDVDLCYRLNKHGVILYNPKMYAVHWGEASDLRTFWRKEVWRGIGNWGGIKSHGLRWDEIPSIGYPLYMLACGLIVSLSGCFDLWQNQMRTIPMSLIASAVPAVFLTLRTGFRVKSVSWMPRLFLLYYLYGIARAFAMLKGWKWVRSELT